MTFILEECSLFFSHDFEQHMDLNLNESCLTVRPAGQPSVLGGKNGKVEHYSQTFQAILFTPATLIGRWLEVTRSVQNKTPSLHFLAHFSADKDEICYAFKAIQVKHVDTIL